MGCVVACRGGYGFRLWLRGFGDWLLVISIRVCVRFLFIDGCGCCWILRVWRFAAVLCLRFCDVACDVGLLVL